MYFTSTTILVCLSNSQIEYSFIVEYSSLNSEIMAFIVCWLGLLTFNTCHTLFTLILCSEVELPFILTVLVSHHLEIEYLYYLIGYIIEGSVGAQLNVENPY